MATNLKERMKLLDQLEEELYLAVERAVRRYRDLWMQNAAYHKKIGFPIMEQHSYESASGSSITATNWNGSEDEYEYFTLEQLDDSTWEDAIEKRFQDDLKAFEQIFSNAKAKQEAADLLQFEQLKAKLGK